MEANKVMKKLILSILITIGLFNHSFAQYNPIPKIAFGTMLDAEAQIKASQEMAKSLVDSTAKSWRQKGDQHRSYFFKEANEMMPYRVCVPQNWDGKKKLPLVMFLHGGWNDESSYLDANDKQLDRKSVV